MGMAQSPLRGFNNNIRHRGRVFHVQTEDSGVRYPHIITHLFADGGRILQSVKTSYTEHVGSEGMRQTVQAMMEDQHHAMLRNLREGHFDGVLEEAGALDPRGESSGPRSQRGGDLVSVAEPSPLVEQRPEPSRQVTAPMPMHGFLTLPEPSQQAVAAAQRDRQATAIGMFHDAPSAEDPSQAVLPASRFTAARPASIFGTSPPPESSRSFFGGDVMSGKSLDEVILGFLAEEFGAPASERGPRK